MKQIEEALIEHSKGQEEYWSNEVSSVDGGITSTDKYGVKFSAYRYTLSFDILNDSLSGLLRSMDDMIKRLINAAVELKKFEVTEQEGRPIIHWRQYPAYTYKDGDITVTIRISCHCDGKPLEGYK